MKGMVVSAVLTCFLNVMFNFAYFYFKTWIKNTYNTSESINFLFSYQAVQRSYQILSLWNSRVLISHQLRCLLILSPSSTTTFALATTFHPQPHPTTQTQAPLLCSGMWAHLTTSQLLQKQGLRCDRPSPCQRDVGGLSSLDGGFGLEGRRGGAGSQRPDDYIMKTSYNKSCSSFSSIPPPSNQTNDITSDTAGQ